MGDIATLVSFVKEVGFPLTLSCVLLYVYITNGKETAKCIDRLNDAFTKMIDTNSNSIDNLVRQNNFMLHALSSLIQGKKDTAKKMIEGAIIELGENRSNENSGNGGEGR